MARRASSLRLLLVLLGCPAFLAGQALLSGGCYLFSDEPKARKQADGGQAEAGEQAGAGDAAGEGAGPEAEAAGGCPAVLSGTETAARTIAGDCKQVRVSGQYRIDGGSLTLAAGAELHFEAGAVLEVGRAQPGSLIVQGSAEQPVRFVGADEQGQGGARWQGLRLLAQARGSSLSHLQIADAGEAAGAALQITGPGVAIDHLRVDGPAGLAVDIAAEGEVSLVDADLAGSVRSTPTAAGGLQELRLAPEAVVSIVAGRLQGAVEWAAGRYRVDGVVRIEGDVDRPALLTLAPGVELRMVTGARLVVGGFGPGTLSADAETELPPADPSAPAGQALADGSITITAADSDRPGSWAGIHVQDQGQLRLHGVALERGGDRGEGVVLAEGASTLRLESCRFSADLVGVELRGSEVVVEVFSDNDFAEVPVALRLGPEQLGTVAGDNHYDEAARIEVARGKVEHDASWAVQGAPIHVLGDVYVDKNATLTVAAGNRLAFAAGAVLGVGYYQRGALDMRASADAPIVLGPAEDGQRWGGVVLGGFARDTHLEHVRLRSSEGPGVELREQAEATLVKVDCAGCGGATVKWSCAAKVGNIGVTASDGTPAALAAPSGCK